jgi:ribose/xylose/arabinose/galactoside ABC-type transport system permease subunit
MTWRNDPHLRPLLIFIACVLLLVAADRGRGDILTSATAFSMFESFSTGGLVALGLGLAIMVREFDLSVVGVYSLAGCIAVLAGQQNPWMGLALALAAGVGSGLAQGLLIVRLRLSSVGVTLGGLLVTAGLAYVLTENRSVAFDNIDVSLALTRRMFGVLSPRSLVVIGVYLIVAMLFATTRWGREIIAIGSDRRASRIAGVDVESRIVLIFVFSGFCAALSGVMLSFSLAAAAPSGLSDVIPPAAAAAILGGVSLAGGAGRPLGIAIGVLILGIVRAGLNALGSPPFVNDICLGAILIAVGLLDGPYVVRRFATLRRWPRRP